MDKNAVIENLKNVIYDLEIESKNFTGEKKRRYIDAIAGVKNAIRELEAATNQEI